MTDTVFQTQVEEWIREMRHVASEQPDTGACAIGSALDLWLWTLTHVHNTQSADDKPCGVHDLQQLADGLSLLLSARAMVLDTSNRRANGGGGGGSHSSEDFAAVYTDICHTQAARAAGEVGRICAELVFGRRMHPTWDHGCEACIQADEIDALEGIMPGISYGARLTDDVLESDGSHPEKAGPCVRVDGLQGFISRRNKLDGCLSGSRHAKDRVAASLAEIARGNGH